MAVVLRRIAGKSGCEIDFLTLTPPGIIAEVVTPSLQALEFLLRKKRQDTGLLASAPAENSFRGKLLGRTHSPSLGKKLTWGQRVTVGMRGCMAGAHWLRESDKLKPFYRKANSIQARRRGDTPH